MAKQVLLNSRSIVIPGWTRKLRRSDISGSLHEAAHSYESRTWLYSDAAEEAWMDGIRPDAVLTGAAGNERLLVEVQVSHKVDTTKEDLVRARGLAMLEIDLSKTLDLDFSAEDFESLVTLKAARRWICAPRAEEIFARKCDELALHLDAVNTKLRAEGVEERDAFGRTKHDREQARRIKAARVKLRESLLPAIDALGRLHAPGYLSAIERERRDKEADQIQNLLARFGGDMPAFANAAHKDAWVVNASTITWQLAVAEKFAVGRPEGELVETWTVVRWVENTFGIDANAGRLIGAQKSDQQRQRSKGEKHPIRSAWFLTDSENLMVPSVVNAVDDLLARLVTDGHLRKLKRWRYQVHGPVGQNRLRIEAEARQQALDAERERVKTNRQNAEDRAEALRAASDANRRHRVQMLADAYSQQAFAASECSDCQRCRWPNSVQASHCDACGGTEFERVVLDAQRIHEMPHRLKSDPRVIRFDKYPFEL